MGTFVSFIYIFVNQAKRMSEFFIKMASLRDAVTPKTEILES